MKTPRPVLALIAVALVIAACGGEATSPTPVETPLSSAAVAPSDSPVSAAAAECDGLVDLDLDAVTAITAELVTSGTQNDLPEFCRVAVTVDPAINIEVWLPTDTYNDRFQAIGGGGYAGSISYDGMAEALRNGYATASTDTGHAGEEFDGSFALAADGTSDMALIEDFASRSLIELTDVSRALVDAFYGEVADYSYWNGCSTGGRQGLALAQRLPEGYDGILAGAPAINWDRFIPALLWPQIVMDEELGRAIGGCKLAAATAAAVDACDGIDGVSDRVVDDPRQCDFDPGSLVGADTPCGEFTNADAAVIQAIWDGPRTADGDFLWYGLARGTPLVALADSEPFPIGLDHHRLWVKQDPSFDWHTLGYAGFEDAFRTSQELFHDVIATDDPDLAPFRDAGGKLLMWHGWYDEIIFPEGSIDYYERVVETLGDPGNVAEFARLFMVPGVYHCGGGPGPAEFDAFGALVEWVETGRAPDAIPASGIGASGEAFTRPLCAYPSVATYDGAGDPQQAASFNCTSD